jgi:putative tricarboxylic transport membrane protein
MIPASPGGGWDRTGRLTMQAMQKEKLISSVQFTNRGGGGGVVGLTDFVRNAKGDDSALMFTGVIMLSSVITSKSPVTIDQTTPLALLTLEYLGIAVPANSPFKTIADLANALKQDPSGLTVGGSAVGSVEHLALALLARARDVPLAKLNFVTFSGNEYVPALVSGKLKAVISGASELQPLVQAGRIRMLATTADSKLPGIDAPTLKESGFDVVIGNWRGVTGAPGMSAKARSEWVSKLDTLSKSASWKDALAAQGLQDAYMSGPAFDRFLATEKTRWQTTLGDLGVLN